MSFEILNFINGIISNWVGCFIMLGVVNDTHEYRTTKFFDTEISNKHKTFNRHTIIMEEKGNGNHSIPVDPQCIFCKIVAGTSPAYKCK